MAARAKKTSAKNTQTALTNTARTPKPAEFTKEEELAFYREMLLIRRFEEKAGQLYGMGFIGGFCHLYIGQEAVVTGTLKTAKEGDQIITSYRDHGHMLAAGMSPRGVMAELTGRQGGFSKGKGICSRKKRIFMADMVLLVRRFQLGQVLRFPINILDGITSPLFILVMVPPIRDRFTKASTWLLFGSSL